jgi:hypothetical protein
MTHRPPFQAQTRQKGMNILEIKAGMLPSGDPGGVTGIGEAVDERWQWSHRGAEIEL